MEARYRLVLSRNSSKKKLACFVNRKYVKKVLINRKVSRGIPKSPPNYNIFINENLTLTSNKIAFLCRKLKMQDHIGKTYVK